jgi:hypothetical protein
MEEFPDCMGVQSRFIGRSYRERQGRRNSGLMGRGAVGIVNLIFLLMSFPHYSLFHGVKVVCMSEKKGGGPTFKFFP